MASEELNKYLYPPICKLIVYYTLEPNEKTKEKYDCAMTILVASTHQVYMKIDLTFSLNYLTSGRNHKQWRRRQRFIEHQKYLKKEKWYFQQDDGDYQLTRIPRSAMHWPIMNNYRFDLLRHAASMIQLNNT